MRPRQKKRFLIIQNPRSLLGFFNSEIPIKVLGNPILIYKIKLSHILQCINRKTSSKFCFFKICLPYLARFSPFCCSPQSTFLCNPILFARSYTCIKATQIGVYSASKKSKIRKDGRWHVSKSVFLIKILFFCQLYNLKKPSKIKGFSLHFACGLTWQPGPLRYKRR